MQHHQDSYNYDPVSMKKGVTKTNDTAYTVDRNYYHFSQGITPKMIIHTVAKYRYIWV